MHDKEMRAEQLIDEIDQAGLRLTAERDAAREDAARYKLMLDEAQERIRTLENASTPKHHPGDPGPGSLMNREEWLSMQHAIAARPQSLADLDKAALIKINNELLDLVRTAGELLGQLSDNGGGAR